MRVSTWRRLTKWEFWPPAVFYPPLAPYLAYLMIKHGGATVFTCANPGIEAGGVVGESKFRILENLGGGDTVARATLLQGQLPAGEKVERARLFMAAHGLDFPIVLKPDMGQRGAGVTIVRTRERLTTCLEQVTGDTILQEYVGGPEFGVFYYRRPSESTGHIFSITEKRMTAVIGNGRDALEVLILADERAVCQARLHLENQRARLDYVPGDGEVVPLVELGTHCRGALFLDAIHLLTPALLESFDRVAKRFDGFFFGRFDVRACEGVDAFREGCGWKVLELNGVTSEATHIYHPDTPLLAAYRVLMTQWRLAFEIGAENRRRGTTPASLRDLAALARDYRREARHHLAM
ncbi:MAG: hypothetical protein AB7I50_15450 [Vicinamibacterales bacterium]